jgi:secreted trypsin-like serine protease
MSRNDVANLKIRLGAHYIKRGESGTHESKAARVVRHKGFSQQTLHWDVAIITMETPAPTGNPKIGPVCLPSGSQTYAEQTATVTGWGSLRENGPQPDELMEVTVRIWDNAQCKSTYGKAAPGGIESHMLCAGQKGKDSCNGDSGGPMVMGTGSTWSQIGVVSWGIGCGKSHYPGVYTRVTVVRDWIDRILRDY